MKRMVWAWVLAAEAVLCAGLSVAGSSAAGAAGALLGFPWQMVGQGLRWMSLSGGAGNAAALALYAVCGLPVQFDYGCFTSIGTNFYANFNFTCVDCCPVTIGENVFLGPNVSLLTPIHPLRWQDRNQYVKQDGTLADKEYAKPITIGNNCWIAGNVTICGGVTIGDGCVIGAGSVVTRDIPPNSLAVGVPCHVVREITEADSLENHPELF